jgi:hypothetical protein
MAFRSSFVTLFKDYRPDGMIQCGTESKSVVSAANWGYHDWVHAVRGSSGFKHITQQTSLDFIPVDITPT